MARRILLLFFAVAFQIVCYAKPTSYNLSGKVTDNNKNPLQGAVVEIPDLKTGTVTDSNGIYTINGLPKGNFVVVANLISYARATVTVAINGNTHQDFVLSESAIESQEVVVTGQSKATEINRSPVPIVAIGAQYLKENISTNIIDALAKVPGVTAVTTGPNISKPFIRGLGFNRILTLYDGMRQEGQQWGDEHGIEVDEYSIDRAEVVKGPASLIYGSDALAGVVNLIPTQPAPDGTTIGNFTSEYQSNNNLVGGSGMMSGNKNGMYWLARVSHKQAMDYSDPVDGKVYATNYNETDANASLGVNKKWGYSHLDLGVFNDLQAIPDGSRDSVTRQFTKQITEIDTARKLVTNDELNTYALPRLHQHVQHYRAMLANNFNIFDGVLAVNLGFERSIRQEFSHPDSLYANIPGLDLRLNSYTYDVKYYFHSVAGWEIWTGVNGMYQTNDATGGTDFVIPSYQQFDIGPFALFKKTFKKLDVAGGIRYDSRTFHDDELSTIVNPTTHFDTYYKGTDTAGVSQQFPASSHTYSGVTYSLGLAYIFSKQFALKANVARGFRAPNIAEISADGVHPGTNIFQVGGAGLKPEFSVQEDVGIEFTSQHVSINLSVFNNDITGYIYNQKVRNASGGDSIKDNATVFQFNATQARLYGGEASVDIHPHPLDWLHFENTISIVTGINKGGAGITINDSNKYLPQIPPVHGISELRANFKHSAKRLANSFVKVQLAIYAAQNHAYLTDNTETPTPAYTLFNAGIGSDFTNKAGKVMFNISVFGNNLMNVAYQDALSRLKYFEPYPDDPRIRSGSLPSGIYNMGRNIGIKLTVPFGVK